MAQRRSQWSVLAVNGTVAVAVLLVVAVLALVVNPPAPPGIAAFAPQASKPITKAPLAQSAQFGNGAGACGDGQVCSASPTPSPTRSLAPGETPAPTPTGPPKGVPSALQCYTWPDGTVTQTYDPQSPPCIATWDVDKGNGGATSPGVTGSEIRVAVATDSKTGPTQNLQPIVDFFNTHYQLYGRKIRLVPYVSKQAEQQFTGTGLNDPSLQRADAATVSTMNVFATTDFIEPFAGSWSLPGYREVLTKHKIISLDGGEVPPYGTAEDLARNAPYQWTYSPTLDTVMDGTATMICRQLAGRKAAYAKGGDAVNGYLRDKVRKFAIVLPEQQFLGGPMPGLPALKSTLGGCGQRDLKVVQYDPNDPNKTTALTASFNDLKNDGVTSIVFVPFTGSANNYAPMKVADRAQFYPEWVTVAWSKYNTDYQVNGPKKEVSAQFGVGAFNKFPQPELEFWYRTYIDAGGGAGESGNAGRGLYNELLLLASGVQMAGPRLTPETFAEGLSTTTFPNPGAAGPPFYQATVGFGPGDVTMVDDLVPFWMDTRKNPQTVGTSKNLNNYDAECYALLGRRFTRDTWPASDSYYRGACR